MHRIKIWFTYFLWPSEQYTYFLRSHFFLTHPVDIHVQYEFYIDILDNDNEVDKESFYRNIVCLVDIYISPVSYNDISQHKLRPNCECRPKYHFISRRWSFYPVQRSIESVAVNLSVHGSTSISEKDWGNLTLFIHSVTFNHLDIHYLQISDILLSSLV